jgi:hypothetical protein
MHEDLQNGVLPIVDFAVIRHRMWLTKTYGEKKYPVDRRAHVLAPYHFTNLWRELDRNSVYLFNTVQQGAGDLVDVVADTLRFRLFNKIETNEAILEKFGTLKKAFRDGEKLYDFLKDREANFTGAYIRCPNLHTVCTTAQNDQLEPLAREVATLLQAGDGRGVRKKVMELYSIGSFLADQLAMDLTWVGGPVDKLHGGNAEKLFTPGYGPGARRGVAYCAETGQGTPDEVLENIRQAFASEPLPRVLGKPVGFNGRELEHTLCEYQKHVRVAKATTRAGGKMRVFNANRDPNRKVVAALPYTWKDAK